MDNLNVIMDISSIIWDESDYQNNEDKYYSLVDGITAFIRKMEEEKPRVLLSGTIVNEMMSGFPYGKPPYYGSSFERQTLSFLSKVETIEYSRPLIPNITSIPNIIKEHFKISVKEEIGFLISTMHTDTNFDNVYFTFEYLWDGDKLKTQVHLNQKDYETIISDRGTELEDFFARLKPVFEHNKKHDKSPRKNREAWKLTKDKLGFVSQLSCYNGKDNDKPQEILEKRYPEKFDGRYISYDEGNEVFVVFRCHKENKYHGFDEYNDNNHAKIPPKVKAYFNK